METVVELARRVRRGEAAATATVAAAVERAADSQPRINAFTAVDAGGAARRAAGIDRRVAAGEDPGPLAGVPVAVKDLIDQEGVVTTNGAVFPPGPAPASATVVKRLEAAGAVIVGRTGLHEFAFGFTSENLHFGPVRNPWNTELSSGGSSGGSAAAVAAGIVPVAVGTDTGGSIRVPAALCGVVGLKVTHGRVPLTGVTPLAPSLDTVGPIARTVADVAAIYTVIAGDDPADPWSAPASVEAPGAPRDPATLVVGIPGQWMDVPTDRIITEAFRSFLDRLTAMGATIETVDEPALVKTGPATLAAAAEVFRVHRERWEAHPEVYGSDVAARLRLASTVDPATLVDALAWDAGARHALARLFSRFDLLVTPTVGSTRKVIGEEEIDVDGERFPHREVIARYTWPVNRVGNPALAVPIGGGEPPASLQLIGPRWGEVDLLEIGLGLEESGIIRIEQPPIFTAASRSSRETGENPG